MDAALKAIAEPRRREILSLIRNAELPAGTIADHFDVTRPAISQHLRVLKDAGLVMERRQGTFRYYKAEPQPLVEIHEFLDSFWDDHLARLVTTAEAEQRRRRT